MQQSPTIRELYENFDLSIRAFNVSKRAGITTVDGLRKHYDKYGNFLNIQNCGLKTNKELLLLISSYNKPPKVDRTPTLPIANRPIKKNISDGVFKLLISEKLNKLSIRSQNGLLQYFGNQIPSPELVKSLFLDKKFDPLKVRNIGKKSLAEIEGFVLEAIDVYELYAYKELEESERVAFTFYECTGFFLSKDDTDLLQKFESRRFPLISFIKNHLATILKVDEIDLSLFQNHFELSKPQLSLDELGEKYDLSTERIRQRRDKVIEVAAERLSLCRVLLPYCNYNLSTSPSFCLSSKDIENKSFEEEINDENLLLSGFILFSLFSQDYYLFSKMDRIRRPSQVQLYSEYNRYKNIKNIFLIKKDVIIKENLLKLYGLILQQLCITRDRDETIDITKQLGIQLVANARKHIKKIIKAEFNLDMDDEFLLLPRNSTPSLYEGVLSVFQKLGRPAHLTELKELLGKNGYGKDIGDATLRTTMNSRKDIFIFFGRDSTYGLREWEKESDFIKGGTIRDIVEEFLEECNEPCHISAITEYVTKYRKTDEKSVLNNLKATNDNRFVFFRNAHFGLASKDYEKLAKQRKYAAKEVSIDSLMEDIFSK